MGFLGSHARKQGMGLRAEPRVDRKGGSQGNKTAVGCSLSPEAAGVWELDSGPGRFSGSAPACWHEERSWLSRKASCDDKTHC